MTTKTKDRILYWGTVLPLLVVIGLLNSHSKDQEQIIESLHTISNTQVELMAASYTNLLNEQSMRFMAEIVELEEHHKKEIGECVQFYTIALEEARKDN